MFYICSFSGRTGPGTIRRRLSRPSADRAVGLTGADARAALEGPAPGSGSQPADPATAARVNACLRIPLLEYRLPILAASAISLTLSVVLLRLFSRDVFGDLVARSRPRVGKIDRLRLVPGPH